MKKVYLVNHIYFDLGIFDIRNFRDLYLSQTLALKDVLNHVGTVDTIDSLDSVPSLDSLDGITTLLLRRFRECLDNESRADFISKLINEELKILACLVNDCEFNCVCKIISKLVIDEFNELVSLDYLNNLYFSSVRQMYGVQNNLHNKTAEILINNVPREVIIELSTV